VWVTDLNPRPEGKGNKKAHCYKNSGLCLVALP